MSEMNDWNNGIMAEFRANAGKVGGPFEGAPMLILHTTGAKSGLERENPLMCLHGENGPVIFASKGGAPSHPDWYHNVLANSTVKVELGDRTETMTARVAQGAEREKLWTAQKLAYPQFDGYEKATTREIPVVVLEPAN